MADQFIQVPPNSIGQKIDTSEVVVGANTVERQRIVLADDSGAASLAKVSNSDPSTGDGGLVVRHVHGNVAGDPEFVSVTNIPHVIVDSTPSPVGGATAANQATEIASLANLDVALSTRTKPSDQQHVIVDSSASVPVTGTFFQATQPVSGTVTTTPPANASTNIAQLAGITADTNSGIKSAGTLRVVLATDQPALTNKLLTTPDNPSNLDVALSTLLKPADTLAGVTTVGSITNPVTVAQPTGTSLHVVVDSAPTTAVTGTFFQATQPVSGTVTALQGTSPFSVHSGVESPTARDGFTKALTEDISTQDLLRKLLYSVDTLALLLIRLMEPPQASGRFGRTIATAALGLGN